MSAMIFRDGKGVMTAGNIGEAGAPPLAVGVADWRSRRCLLRTSDGFERIVSSREGAHEIRWGRLDGSFLCFERNGEELRGTETLNVYVERLERKTLAPPAAKVVREFVKVPPTREGLAHALFRTDENVQAFVARVADASIPSASVGFRLIEPTRVERAYNIAWDRDEAGLRTEAFRRADHVLTWLPIHDLAPLKVEAAIEARIGVMNKEQDRIEESLKSAMCALPRDE